MTAIPLRAIETVGENKSDATFDDLWTLYPRRVAKRDAERAWNRLTADEKVAALSALVKWRRVWLARGEIQYVPHAATWLNGARWDDELPEQAQMGPQHASHVAATMLEQAERGAMPQEVRDLLTKLKARR